MCETEKNKFPSYGDKFQDSFHSQEQPFSK